MSESPCGECLLSIPGQIDTMSTPTPPPQDKEESVFAHIGRSCANTFHKCFGCVQTSDEKAKIKYKEYQIESRKKAFGVDYLNLLASSASEEELKACIDTAQTDITNFESEIKVLEEEIARVNTETEKKISSTKPDQSAVAASASSAPPKADDETGTKVETTTNDSKPEEPAKKEEEEPEKKEDDAKVEEAKKEDSPDQGMDEVDLGGGTAAAASPEESKKPVDSTTAGGEATKE